MEELSDKWLEAAIKMVREEVAKMSKREIAFYESFSEKNPEDRKL